MIRWLICGVFILIFLLYLVKRKPVWLKQITPHGKELTFCSNCGYIWTPTTYSGYQLEMTPPTKCPQCKREMRVYH